MRVDFLNFAVDRDEARNPQRFIHVTAMGK
jgi:hypothetical protein